MDVASATPPPKPKSVDIEADGTLSIGFDKPIKNIAKGFLNKLSTGTVSVSQSMQQTALNNLRRRRLQAADFDVNDLDILPAIDIQVEKDGKTEKVGFSWEVIGFEDNQLKL